MFFLVKISFFSKFYCTDELERGLRLAVEPDLDLGCCKGFAGPSEKNACFLRV